jgi:cytochrome c oxidase cbb3-type subunit 3
MSDFLSSGWSVFVAAATILGLVACLLLLAVAARHRVMANDNSTGHTWDVDLRELNNPLPRWWMWLFIITVIFSGIYLVFYPGAGSRAGTLGWSSAGQHAAEQEAARASMAKVYARYAPMAADALIKEPAAMAIGERLFINNCAACHGSDGKGSKGFPNLTDGDWLGAGTPDYIQKTITGGRIANMPPMAAAVGDPAAVHSVAQYVLSLSNNSNDAIAEQAGKPKFAVCAACHGADGKGNPVIGAPNLTDDIWLHGFGEAAITEMVNKGKVNVMPPFGERLAPEQIHVLAAYVASMSRSRTVALQ